MIIDFHAHVYPEKVAAKAAKYIQDFYTLPVACKADVESLLACGRRAGIDCFVVHSVAQSPSQVQGINDFLMETCAAHPQLIGFAALHKNTRGAAAEIDRVLAGGLKGVKLHPDMQRFMMDDEAMFPIYDLLQSRRLPVMMHCGDYRTGYSHPARLARVLTLFPRLVVIGAHFGGWSVFDLALEHLQDKNCYFDVSSSMMFLGPRRSAELIRLYGAHRFLFGSDFPMWDPGAELERLRALGLAREELEMLMSQNALDILGE